MIVDVPRIDLNAAMAKIGTLARGECLIYYRGNLSRDRENRSNPDFMLIDAVAKLAWELYGSRKITLHQKRFGEFGGDCFNYIAAGIKK